MTQSLAPPPEGHRSVSSHVLLGVWLATPSLITTERGILATLVWHYSIDACYTALLLLRSGDTYLVWSGCAAAFVMLLPLGLALVRYRLRGGFESDVGLRNADEPEPRHSVAAPPEPAVEAWTSPRVPRRRLLVGALVAAVLLLAYFVPAERPGAGLALQLEREDARSQAAEQARRLGIEPDSFDVAMALVSRSARPPAALLKPFRKEER